jgi:catechol 2,3-dioxygenase-like lactoylglutathione lyase family enzyme
MFFAVIVVSNDKKARRRRRNASPDERAEQRAHLPAWTEPCSLVVDEVPMNEAPRHAPAASDPTVTRSETLENFAHVRYQVTDTDRSIAFYTEKLGFSLESHVGRAFASVSRGKLRLILGGPGSSGARPMPDGEQQTPGGWNRILVYVDDLDAEITRLKKEGVRFRNNVETGPGGSQIQIEDPDGNPIELHEAPKGDSR